MRKTCMKVGSENVIEWPRGRKVGRINGKTFNAVWRKCQKDADKYVEDKFPHLLGEE